MAFDRIFSTIDCDDMIFELLNKSQELKNEISGGIYVMSERPDGSNLEDIVINTPSLTQIKPQRGYSNVNIYAPDLKLKIKGKEQTKANRDRLKTIRNILFNVLEKANLPDIEHTIQSETPVSEEKINQHFLNIRIYWLMC